MSEVALVGRGLRQTGQTIVPGHRLHVGGTDSGSQCVVGVQDLLLLGLSEGCGSSRYRHDIYIARTFLSFRG